MVRIMTFVTLKSCMTNFLKQLLRNCARNTLNIVMKHVENLNYNMCRYPTVKLTTFLTTAKTTMKMLSIKTFAEFCLICQILYEVCMTYYEQSYLGIN